jgi:hypothetical protein
MTRWQLSREERGLSKRDDVLDMGKNGSQQQAWGKSKRHMIMMDFKSEANELDDKDTAREVVFWECYFTITVLGIFQGRETYRDEY